MFVVEAGVPAALYTEGEEVAVGTGIIRADVCALLGVGNIPLPRASPFSGFFVLVVVASRVVVSLLERNSGQWGRELRRVSGVATPALKFAWVSFLLEQALVSLAAFFAPGEVVALFTILLHAFVSAI